MIFRAYHWGAKARALSCWHRWFAWYPVKARMGHTQMWVWFRSIQRRGNYYQGISGGWWEWKYRILLFTEETTRMIDETHEMGQKLLKTVHDLRKEYDGYRR